MQIIETYTTPLGATYTLYSTGKCYKSVVEVPESKLKSGKVIPAYRTERTHRNLQAAMNSKHKPKAAS